ncbi:MAG: phosphatase, partial [Verrucomicrobia bacterium]|nr:phosphatase [Verrucomicrobiota bacterium]
AVVEDSGTFAGNARKKAWALHRVLPEGSCVLADDSGLSVEFLGGAPGVESAYYAGPAGDSGANLTKLVAAMQGVPAERRRAHFTCVLVLIDADACEHLFEGTCEGRLLDAPQGGAGFGYDPLFVPDGQAHSFAQLSDVAKNGLSHRARAWAKFAAWLRSIE